MSEEQMQTGCHRNFWGKFENRTKFTWCDCESANL